MGLWHGLGPSKVMSYLKAMMCKIVVKSTHGIPLMGYMAHIWCKFFEAKYHHHQAAEYASGEIENWYALER